MTASSNKSYLATPAKLPILYSFRRCPYAMRARMALMVSGISCELREILLKDKPQAMLDASSKGTVPVLQLGSQIIDESIDVMKWALSQSDPAGWDGSQLDHDLLEQNDGEFKVHLDQYKYFDRFPQSTQQEYFLRGLEFIQTLEQEMVSDQNGNWFLLTPRMSAIDAAIFPFIRQFAHVDQTAFEALPFNRVKSWLTARKESSFFESIMTKYPVWRHGQVKELFGNSIL